MSEYFFRHTVAQMAFSMVGRSAVLVYSFYLAVNVTLFRLFLFCSSLSVSVCACAFGLNVCPLSFAVIGH